MTNLAEVCFLCRSYLVWISWVQPVLAIVHHAATFWFRMDPWAQRAWSWCIDTGTLSSATEAGRISAHCCITNQGSKKCRRSRMGFGRSAFHLHSVLIIEVWLKIRIKKLRNAICRKCWTPPGVTLSLYLLYRKKHLPLMSRFSLTLAVLSSPISAMQTANKWVLIYHKRKILLLVLEPPYRLIF